MESVQVRKAPGIRRKPVPPKPPPEQSESAMWRALPSIFIAVALLAAATFRPLRWFISGAPVLTYCFLRGEANGHRILPFLPLWTIISTLNLVYAVASTSWLLYWVFTALCYPSIVVASLFQFECATNLARQTLRKTILRDLHFIKDKVAFFDLPALEIDSDVNGLFVVRGVTLSLSTLTLVAHGVEVGIKLSEDMELAIQTDKVTVSLLRNIEVDDVYANVKGGEWEMTFGSVKLQKAEGDDDSFMVSDTPILRAATGSVQAPVKLTKMTEAMTGGDAPEEASDTKSAFRSVTQLSLDEDQASSQYHDTLRYISQSSEITRARQGLKKPPSDPNKERILDEDNPNDVRAAICAQIHNHPSVPHPPKKSIRLSTLKKTNYPNVKKFLHRMPLLYRMLLMPICYFHPVTFKSITAAGSGKWFVSLMDQYLFKHYSTQDPEIRKLKNRISSWLADANFAVELGKIHSTAQFPISTNYDIEAHFKMNDIMAYRTLPDAVDLKQVVRLAGADATLSIPTYMFPHHEHIMPPIPTEYDEMQLEQAVKDAKGTPKEVQAQAALDQLRRDEANMHLSAHAHLPARFHQDLLNFIAALVKATKVIENDKDFEEAKSLRELKRSSISMASVASDSETSSVTSNSPIEEMSVNNSSFKNFLRKVDTGFKDASSKTRDSMRKAGVTTVSAMANDRWIAKLVGKITKKLERAQGDLGYSGNIPVSLERHRMKAEDDSKLLP